MSTGPQEEGQVPGPLPESSERMGSQPHTGTLPGLKPHWGVTAGHLAPDQGSKGSKYPLWAEETGTASQEAPGDFYESG